MTPRRLLAKNLKLGAEVTHISTVWDTLPKMALVAQGPPPYGARMAWTPRIAADYGGGGAFPEIHVAQYPLDMGKKTPGAVVKKFIVLSCHLMFCVRVLPPLLSSNQKLAIVILYHRTWNIKTRIWHVLMRRLRQRLLSAHALHWQEF